MVARDDNQIVSESTDPEADVIRLYDEGLPMVFGYLRSRCGSSQLAEDLTADTFLAALGQARRDAVDDVTTAWLIGIARHKLADHWRRAARTVGIEMGTEFSSGATLPLMSEDPWENVVDRQRVEAVLDRLGPHHRSALVLRHLDGLPVPEVASLLGRTVHATEALLVRSRVAFRAAYEGSA